MSKKFCPFAKDVCCEKNCALWSEDEEQCSIKLTAESLNDISSVIGCSDNSHVSDGTLCISNVG